MATEIVPVGDSHHLDADQFPATTVEINGTATAPLSPPGNYHDPCQRNGNGQLVTDTAAADNGRTEGELVEAPATHGRNQSYCDRNNKIVIKSKRSTASDSGQNPQGQCTENNELVANDMEDIQRLYETKPEAFRQWLAQRAPCELLTRIRHNNMTSKRESVSSDLFHRWIAFSPTKVRDFQGSREFYKKSDDCPSSGLVSRKRVVFL